MQDESNHSDPLVLTRDQVRAFDAWAIHTLGIPGVVLMENAGRSCAEHIAQRLASMHATHVCVFCGTGNNGGDGYVVARHLINQGIHVSVVLCGDKDKVKGDARINLDILQALQMEVTNIDLEQAGLAQRIKALARESHLIVDALFGTGLRGTLRAPYMDLINGINDLGLPIVAVDIPSGLDCDTANVLSTAIRAQETITFVALKKGYLLDQARIYTGDVHVVSIGIEPTHWPSYQSKINTQ
jgi:NAD(P)H-hydrate epimerase